MKHFCLFFAGLLLAKFAIGQEYSFKHYKAENGLSYNTVFCSLQDSKGFMWFGTLDGLNRFDGKNFKIFRNIYNNSKTIGNNFISALYEDKAGNMWVGTHNGLYCYKSLTEEFTLVTPTYGKWIGSITSDSKGNLWFISGGYLCRYKMSANRLTMIMPPAIQMATLISNKEGEIWFATSLGLLASYNEERNILLTYDVFKNSPKVANKQITKICDDGNGHIIIGTRYQGVKIFDKKTFTYRDVVTDKGEPLNVYTNDILKIADNEFWFGTNSGILIYNIKTGAINNITKANNDVFSLSDNVVNTFCKDNQGGIWIGTNFGGVDYYNKANAIFERFTYADKEYPNGNVVGQISTREGGGLWVGTEDEGLYKLDTKSRIFTRYPIPYKSISAILQVGNELWIGRIEKGLDVIDVRTKTILRSYKRGTGKHDLNSNLITFLYKTRNGKIYAGTSGGLYLYDFTIKQFNRVTALPDFYTSCILEDHNGNLWIGCYISGVYYFDTHTNQGKAMPIDFSNTGRNNNTVTSILEDSYNNIWLSSESGGIGKFNPRTGKAEKFTMENGFPSNNTFKILEDKQKTLWISTSKGIIQFNPLNKKTLVFTKSNGLVSDQFNYNSGYKDNTGNLYFGGTQGMVSFNPSKISYNNISPPLYITGIQINNKDVTISVNTPLTKSIIYTDKVKLNYNQSNLSIDFASLSYPLSHMIAYQYKLEGVDKKWNRLESNRRVYFTNLAPGSYTFRIKAALQHDTPNQTEKTLEIIISPPFWKSTWAIAFYICVTVGLAYYILKNYLRKIEAANKRRFELLEIEKDKKIYESKIEFFTNIAHEIRTPLTLITAPLENIQNSDDLNEIHYNAKLMDKSTVRLLKLTNQLLDFRKSEQEGFRLNFVKVDIAQLLNDIFSRFKLTALQSQLKYTISIQKQPLMIYADAEAVDKIISNIISNAIKYSATVVHVSLANNDDYGITLEVENDGYVIPAKYKDKIFEPFYRIPDTDKKAGNGIGLALARSLTELHHGKLVLHPGNSKNTFSLTLPVHQENEFDLVESPHEPNVFDALPEGTKTRPTILVVEDNKDLMSFLVHDLASEYEVLNASNGEEAISVLQQHTVQLIVSDVMMPIMDGIALCKYLKTNIELSHIPLILLTAKSTLQSKIEGLETGADAYMEKPFSTYHLKAQVASLLFNRLQQQQFFAKTPLAGVGTMAHSKADEIFLNNLNSTILAHMADPDLDIAMLADFMNMSRANLFRKIKAVCNLSPGEMINIIRLKKAAELIQQNNNKLYEIADMVGFNSRIVFTRNFNKQFGMSPSEFVKSLKKENKIA
ncbi:hybrid sensor histidine kinase/response regulator [Mucilaginibacter limnophilus]|uniref:histidine kinase n=1 Tax=Mucilaginibacter limnophilus TaxID=1932778 RepID=A0A3S2ULZ4_9SPHI|nr:hybrid sensor histidine kinase/response regulator transcription factor [Mucilaginibacter limnophilus]RVU00989.1 hybrid sensor histidine kinase/response regulator [Mucilaginibacter limnophilus]